MRRSRRFFSADSVRRHVRHPKRNHTCAFLWNYLPHTLADIVGDADYVGGKAHAKTGYQPGKIARRVLVPTIEVIFKWTVPSVNRFASQQARGYQESRLQKAVDQH